MKKLPFIFFSFITSLLISCGLFKKASIITNSGIKDEAIQIAIRDFSKTRLYRKDNVFDISKRVAINNKNILIINISKNNTKLLLTNEVKVGSKGKIASKFVEIDKKLFYWWDDDYPLTQEALAVFSKYNLLQDDEGGMIKYPDNILDETQKFAFYYFCKNNFTIYKRVVTNKGWFYDNAPQGCKCDSLKN